MNPRSTKRLILSTALLGFSVYAQDSSYVSVMERDYFSDEDKKISSVASPDVKVTGNTISLSAGTANDKATFKISPSKEYSGLTIKIETPIKKGKKSANLYSSTDVFTDSTAMTVALNFNKDSQNSAVIRKYIDSNAQSLKNYCYDHPKIFDVDTYENLEESEANKKIKDDCNNISDEDLLTKYEKKTDKVYNFTVLKNILNQISFSTYGLFSTIGYEDYEHFIQDPATKLNEDGILEVNNKKSNRTPWGIGGYYQFLKPDEYAFWVQLEFQKGYKAEDEEVRCLLPSDDEEIVKNCMTKQSSAPNKEINRNITLGGRGKIYGKPISLSVTHDFEDGEYTVSLPMYLINNEKSEWTAGLRYEFDSDKSEHTVAFFVGSAFNFSFN
ncbi:hypothetical protein [uncultured Pseudoalteromonas sp.]|uniref:hypothetical protein n=1 Tax=uncultured Pseudoalteromonas sp. TaxID=114053 RepID=UPI0025FE86D0|nr:hypothetical protein [uncultured Pseudoalteromonas sp.]